MRHRVLHKFACFAGCFRLSCSNRNKKYKPQPTKDAPQDERASYLFHCSLHSTTCLFCFISFHFRLFVFTEAAALRSIVLRSLFFVSFEMSLFPSILVPSLFSPCVESTSYVFPFGWMVFLYLVTTGWIFYISLLINQPINQ